MTVQGLTHPYTGATACSRLFAHGHTFRWAKGDRYIAVMRGNCIELRRHLIIEDRQPAPVLEGKQPLADVIPATHGDWSDSHLLRHIADTWARSRRRV